MHIGDIFDSENERFYQSHAHCVQPFSANQIHSYIKQYVSQHETIWKEAEQYERAIDEILGLRKLIITPFMLKLTVQVLPQLHERFHNQSFAERGMLTRATLYDAFIEQWFIFQEQKLRERKQIRQHEDIKPEFWAYAKALAQAMHEQRVVQAVYKSGENPWKRFFDPANARTSLHQSACLIREVRKNRYAFIHTSLLEYFLSRNIYENILQKIPISKGRVEASAAAAAAIDSSVVESSLVEEYENPLSKWQQDYFNQYLLVEEHGVLQFLADRVKESHCFKELLFNFIYASKNNSAMKIAAANAITVLNIARVAFSGLDLSGIQVPNADISFGLFNYTNFSSANLQGINLCHSYLNDASLNKADMASANFGQLPFFKLKAEVNVICNPQQGNYLAGGVGKNVVVWDQTTYLKHYDKRKFVDNVTAVAFSMHGKYFVATDSRELELWEVAATITANKFDKLPYGSFGNFQDTKGIRCIAFTPDEKYLAGAGVGKALHIWEIKSQRLLYIDTNISKPDVKSISFCPNGKFLATLEGICNDKNRSSDHNYNYDWQTDLQLWSVKNSHNGFVLKRIKCVEQNVSAFAFCQIKSYLVTSGMEKTIRIWQMKPIQLIGEIEDKSDECQGHAQCLALSSDGKLLASGHKATIRLWSMESFTPIGKLEGHTDIINTITFHNNGGYLSSGSNDKTVRMWKINAEKMNSYFYEELAPLYAKCILSPNGKYLAVVYNKITIQFISTEARLPFGILLKGHTGNIHAIVFSNDGRFLASGGSDRSLLLWDVDTQSQLGMPMLGHSGAVICINFSHDNLLLASGSEDKSVRLWSVQTQTLLNVLPHTCLILSIAFSLDNVKLISVNYDEVVRFWKVDSQSLIQEINYIDFNAYEMKNEPFGIKSKITCGTISPDGNFLAWGVYREGHYGEKLWRTDILICHNQTNHAITLSLNDKGLNGHNVRCIAFTQDSKFIAAGGEDKCITLWDVEHVYKGNVIYRGTNTIISINFNFDSAYLAFATTGGIGLLHRSQTSDSSCYNLVWISNTPTLDALRLSLRGTIGLNPANFELLKQLGAIADKTIIVEDDDNLMQSAAVSQEFTSHLPKMLAPLAKGSAEASTKKGIFARLRGSSGSGSIDQKDDKTEKRESFLKKH